MAVVLIQYRMLYGTGLMKIEECHKLLCIGYPDTIPCSVRDTWRFKERLEVL